MLFAWLSGRPILGLARWIWALLMPLAVIGSAWWLYGALTANPKAEARLSRNQAGAAAQSGSDAVNTVGAAGTREAAGEALTRENERTIRDAEGADALVAAPARDAGLHSLCSRRAYRGDARCVQFADP